MSAEVCAACGSMVRRGALYCPTCGTPAPRRHGAGPVRGVLAHDGSVPGAPSSDVAVQPHGLQRHERPGDSRPGHERPGREGHGREGMVGTVVNLELANASTGKRAGAKLIDLGIAWLLQLVPFALGAASLLSLSGSRYPTSADQQALLAATVWYVVGGVLGLALWVFCWAWEAKTGKTPGQAMLGLRTSSLEGLAPGWGAVFVRNLVFGLICLIPFVGVVLALISNAFDPNSKRQGWHDKAARTFVFDVRAGRDPLTTGGINGPASFAPRPELPAVQEVASPMPVRSPAPVTSAAPVTSPPSSAPRPHRQLSAAVHPAAEVHPDAEVAQTRFSRAVGERSGAADEVVLSFSDGRRVALRGPVLVGRNPAGYEEETVQELLAVDDPGKSVSKTHLAVWSDGSRVWVQDRRSTNGTRIVRGDGGSSPAPAGQPVEVDAGDVVHFGDYFFSVGRSRA